MIGSVEPSPAVLVRTAFDLFDPVRWKKRTPHKGVFLGAGDRTRTGTPSLAADFESATSTISSHRQVCYLLLLYPRFTDCALRVPVSGCGAQNFQLAVRSRNFDRCPSLGSLLPPQAALPSLPRLEPVRHRWRRILSPLRLLFSHTGMVPI